MNSHPYWHDAKNHPGEEAPMGSIPRRCFICGEAVPCKTMRALDGGEQP